MNKLRSHVASKELKESLATFKYVYIYIYIYMYIYIYIINTCLHVHVPTNIDTFKHACILDKHTCIHISIRTYIGTCIFTYIGLHAYIHTYTHKYIHVHADIHQGRTGTQNRPGQFSTSTLPALYLTSTLPTQPWQNPKNRLFSTQKSPFYHFNPTGPPGIAQIQAYGQSASAHIGPIDTSWALFV